MVVAAVGQVVGKERRAWQNGPSREAAGEGVAGMVGERLGRCSQKNAHVWGTKYQGK